MTAMARLIRAMSTSSWRVAPYGGKFRRATRRGYEYQSEGVPAVMAEDFDQKNVGIVAAIIGAVVLSLGLIGIMLYFT